MTVKFAPIHKSWYLVTPLEVPAHVGPNRQSRKIGSDDEEENGYEERVYRWGLVKYPCARDQEKLKDAKYSESRLTT